MIASIDSVVGFPGKWNQLKLLAQRLFTPHSVPSHQSLKEYITKVIQGLPKLRFQILEYCYFGKIKKNTFNKPGPKTRSFLDISTTKWRLRQFVILN